MQVPMEEVMDQDSSPFMMSSLRSPANPGNTDILDATYASLALKKMDHQIAEQ
jgi:hypothetical protein